MSERQLFAQRREVRDDVVQPRKPRDHKQLAPPARAPDLAAGSAPIRCQRRAASRSLGARDALGCARIGQANDVIQRRSRNEVRRPQGSTASMPLLGEHIEHARQCEHGAPPRVWGAVVVSVVEQQDRPLRHTVGHARGDRLGSGALPPVASPVGPQQRAPARTPREAQRARVEHPVGRAVQRGRDARWRPRSPPARASGPREPATGRGATGCDGGGSAGRSCVRRRGSPPGSEGLRSTCSPTRKNVARTPRLAEDLEHGGGPLRVRTVVEGERPAALARGAILDSQRAAQRGPDRRRRARKAHRPRAGERR